MVLQLSVIIPAHGAAAHIARALDSIAAQTVLPHEVIVVDSGSHDASADIAAAHPIRERLPLRVLRLTPGTPGQARNSGIAASTGDHIAVLDPQDVWLPEHLEALQQAHHRHPLASLYWTAVQPAPAALGASGRWAAADVNATAQWHARQADGIVRVGADIIDALLEHDCIALSAAAFKRSMDGQTASFDPELAQGLEPLFLLTALSSGVAVFNDSTTVVLHREPDRGPVPAHAERNAAWTRERLAALHKIGRVPAVAMYANRSALWRARVNAELQASMQRASAHGLHATWQALAQAIDTPSFDTPAHAGHIASCLWRAAMVSLRASASRRSGDAADARPAAPRLPR